MRVNNEHLDTFRTTCYAELRDRVRGLSMYEAVLEVNHWCHEHVTYQPSDSRTSPPLSSMRSAIGRCGEESTYTVAALRAVGIPARQVYTPRWAHTDDNHAWVEAWVDGNEDLLLVTQAGILIRTAVENIRTAGRATQGVIVMRFKEDGDKVISLALTDRDESEETETGTEETEA